MLTAIPEKNKKHDKKVLLSLVGITSLFGFGFSSMVKAMEEPSNNARVNANVERFQKIISKLTESAALYFDINFLEAEKIAKEALALALAKKNGFNLHKFPDITIDKISGDCEDCKHKHPLCVIKIGNKTFASCSSTKLEFKKLKTCPCCSELMWCKN